MSAWGDDRRGEDARRVHPVVERLAGYGWRILVLVVVLLGALWLLRELWVVVLALVIATFISRAVDAPVRWLRGRGAPPAVAALGGLVLFLGSISLLVWIIVPRVADEFEALGPTIEEAVDDVERWLVQDAPLDLDKGDLDELREEAREAVTGAVRSSSSTILSGAIVAFEVLAGLLLALVATFFFLKDGPRFQTWFLDTVRPERRELAGRLGARAWATIGGYLRGAALLGLVEGVAIGITLALVGAELAWPVALLTFAAAFVPIVGAVLAGLVAVLVALATAELGGAVVVAVVALVVQQLDNDLLAPVVYGRALQMHPLIILFAVVSGGALFGIAGTVLAVPVTAVALNVVAEARREQIPAA